MIFFHVLDKQQFQLLFQDFFTLASLQSMLLRTASSGKVPAVLGCSCSRQFLSEASVSTAQVVREARKTCSGHITIFYINIDRRSLKYQ